ncbi:MAG: Gfo/Idh/MocA family oxidoreductase [Verrucomicrobia bacterium]|nr:Gfo/Idh/MocA family oxidoreductase [Verrucomicrobiota bacterium]
MISSPNAPLRVGIVGCGAVTRECHIPALQLLPGVEIAWLCDRNEAFAIGAKNEFGLKASLTTKPEEMAGKIDAAIVAVPPRFHAPVTIQLLQMGVDVFCEKPLAVTAGEAQTMVDAAAKADRFLSVGLVTRFDANNTLLRKILHDPLVGEIREIVAETGSQLGWAMLTGAYYDRKQTGGGVFFDTGVHLIDRVLWLFGDMTDLEYEDDSYGGVESNAVLRGKLHLAGRDVLCRLGFSWTHGLSNTIRVVGSEGTLEARIREPDVLVLERRVSGEVMHFLAQPKTKSANSYHAQMADWVESCRARRIPFVTGASAVKALRLIEQAYAIRKPMKQPWVETFAP